MLYTFEHMSWHALHQCCNLSHLFVLIFDITENHGNTTKHLLLVRFRMFHGVFPTHGLAPSLRLLKESRRFIFIHIFHNCTHSINDMTTIVSIITNQHDLVQRCFHKFIFSVLFGFTTLYLLTNSYLFDSVSSRQQSFDQYLCQAETNQPYRFN